MKVLVIGSGGREHAICSALKKSSKVTKLFAAPGNGGISEIAECISIGDTEVEALVEFAKTNEIDLIVVGPESSLEAGIVDVCRANNLKIFGATQKATLIESSKEFAKELMKENGIPTANYEVFDSYQDAIDYIEKGKIPTVIKYDGLAAGKGVVVATTVEEAKTAVEDMLLHKKYGNGRVIIEEFLQGQEFSFMCLVNGRNVFPLALAQDHKRAFENDKGPNTGGMGAYSPLPFISEEDEQFALNSIMQKTADALCTKGYEFCGILYGGLIKTDNGIKVIEFNARFGDPETEVVLPRLKSDIFDIFNNVLDGKKPIVEWDNRHALGIVLAAKGYPQKYEKGFEIKNLDKLTGVEIFQMGTKKNGEKTLANGGRVLFVTALADSVKEARAKVLCEISKIECSNLFYRKDIGNKAIE